MKGKKFLSWVMAAALCLSATVLSANAASFPDTANHWAAKYIDDVVDKGIFIGIKNEKTGVTEFVPDKDISISEVLVTCARIAVDSDTRAQISADRADQIKSLMGEELTWFQSSAAVCLEAGILSYSELKELYQSGDLLTYISKEKFAVYLTRAMQLEPMAKSLPSYSLDFSDKKDITPGLEPYIYVLNMYSIITGTDTGVFQPGSKVNRAVASTMLSRATDFMEENGTSTELSEYTDYDWVAGSIVSAAAGDKGVVVLTIQSTLSGARSISLPADVSIYKNSMLVESDKLKAGEYARVNLDSSGAPIDVRLSGTVESHSGSVVGISEDAIMLSEGGATTTVNYDRFTEVQVGDQTGDRALIDLDAGYTTATYGVDQLGRMVTLKLSGGSHKREGLISSVESVATGGVIVSISGFDGQLQNFTVPTTAAVTANGLILAGGTLNSSYKGSYVSLRVSNDNASSVISAAVDTNTKYIQGAVKTLGTSEGTDTVTITDLATKKATTYKVADKATFAYNGAPVTYGGIQKDWFATVRLQSGALAALWAYPGANVTEGVISGISYPAGTTKEVVSVTKSDGSVSSFEFDLKDNDALPLIRRSGKTSSIDKLRSGDVVTITVRYSTVTQIDATPQSANVTGTITEVNQTTSGVTIKVELDGGGSQSYSVGGDVSVTRGGETISMFDLRTSNHVAMVTSGDQVISIDVDKTTGSSNQISGTVIYVNTTDKTITFRANDGTGEGKLIMVSVPAGTPIQDASGNSVNISKLETGNTLLIFGAYSGDQFKATLVVRN